MSIRTDHGRRSQVIAPHGMVATSQPLAVQVGVDVLKKGGHAVDAAIAVNAMLGLVEPMSCGLGGDLFAIVWDAKTEALVGFNGSGRAPQAMTRELFSARDLDRIPDRGPLSWTAPGCVDSWFTLHDRFGRLPIDELLGPAIAYAESGFPVSPVIGRMWKAAEERLAADPGAAATFLVGGRAPKTGELMRNPDLATSLRAVCAGGRDAFYRGSIAERIVACAETVGGLLGHEDLADHTSTWDDPVPVRYRSHNVWELPPNGQGIAALQMLGILEGFDLAGMGHNSAELLHLLIEAKKCAYEDRARYYADPAFADVPVGELISPEYAARRRQQIVRFAAATRVPAGDPHLEAPPENGDTVYLTVVDRNRNAVSLIQSIYNDFGSGIVPPGTGFALQNRGSLFHLDPDHPNCLEPGKRPFHTIIPAFVTRNGHPVFSFGVMGGDMQPQGHVQILINRLDFGMDVQAAGDALRWRHVGSSTPTGKKMRDGGVVLLESGFPQSTFDGLRAVGHRVEVRPYGSGFGGYQGIRIDPETGMLHGGSEPRKDGCAIGY
jgi:gamma-glutamyltranspeptidase/glutathione hydrolase